MGEQAYLLDCYCKEFSAKVISVLDNLVELDKTYFYPTSGGQPFDTGKIIFGSDEFNVLEVLKKDNQILHQLDKPGIKVGDIVNCKIDWERRYKLMRYHTASHILATIIFNETGSEITGNQLYTDKARVDFSLQDFDRSLMKSFEEKTNNIINNNIAVQFRILDRDEAFQIPSLVKLRKQFPESITKIRIVDIGDFDHQACGGTHVSSTSEIGEIEIYELENKGKDRRRIYFRLK